MIALSRQGCEHLEGSTAEAVAKGAYVLQSPTDGAPQLVTAIAAPSRHHCGCHCPDNLILSVTITLSSLYVNPARPTKPAHCFLNSEKGPRCSYSAGGSHRRFWHCCRHQVLVGSGSEVQTLVAATKKLTDIRLQLVSMP